MSSLDADVYTLDEVARAAGVPTATVRTLVTAGDLRPIAGTAYFGPADVLRIVPMLRSTAVVMQPVREPRALLSAGLPVARAERRLPLLASMGAHAALLTTALWLTATAQGTAATAPPPEPVRLVFLQVPGEGGGGGGSGARQRRAAPRLQRATLRPSATTAPAAALSPAPSAPAPEAPPALAPAPPVAAVAPSPPPPAPPVEVVAPVAPTASHNRDRAGVLDGAVTTPDSQGPGTGGRSGTGQGAGSGEGLGSGIGEGAGGGVGGGPYRPGSGIEPPRLVREVKAEYTEQARRRGVTGNVLLEIIVTRQGSVGTITVTRGLGLGLDERAVDAVRRWQFAPARRLGQPVDVVVEVSVEFKLR